jgi:hypothetical protein
MANWLSTRETAPVALGSRPRRIPVMYSLAFLLGLSIASCTPGSQTSATQCVSYPLSLLNEVASGLKYDRFRLANAWGVKSGQPIDAVNLEVASYFVSADIVAPNGEFVVGTWLTNDLTKAGLMYSVSPSAAKYTDWGPVGDRSTAGINMDTPGAKESVSCVLTNRGRR